MLSFLKKHYILIVILAVGSILRLAHLTFQSLWFDELYTAFVADPALSFSEVIQRVYEDRVHPPLYALVYHYAYVLFGYSDFVGRFVAAIFGIASIAALYFLLKEQLGKNVAYLGALIFAINPYSIQYSQETRMYTMYVFFTIMSFYFFFRMLDTSQDTKHAKIWYILFSILNLYTHYFAFFILLAQFIINMIRLDFSSIKGRIAYVFSLYSWIGVGLLPWIFYLFKVFNDYVSGGNQIYISHIPEPNSLFFHSVLFKFFYDNQYVLLLIGIAFISLFVTVNRVSFLIKEKRVANFISDILITIFILLCIPYLLSLYMTLNIFNQSYVMSSLPFLCGLIALGICYIKHRVLQTLIIITFFLVTVLDFIKTRNYYGVKTKEDFKSAVAYIKHNNVTNAEVYITYFPAFYEYYFKTLKVENYKLTGLIQDKTDKVTKYIKYPTILLAARDSVFGANGVAPELFYVVDGIAWTPIRIQPDPSSFLLINGRGYYGDINVKFYVKLPKESSVEKVDLSQFQHMGYVRDNIFALWLGEVATSTSIKVHKGSNTLALKAFGSTVNGTGPVLRVSIDGKIIKDVPVSISGFEEIRVDYVSDSDKSIKVDLQMINDESNEDADRNIYFAGASME